MQRAAGRGGGAARISEGERERREVTDGAPRAASRPRAGGAGSRASVRVKVGASLRRRKGGESGRAQCMESWEAEREAGWNQTRGEA
jgi:hypothetical protein